MLEDVKSTYKAATQSELSIQIHPKKSLPNDSAGGIELSNPTGSISVSMTHTVGEQNFGKKHFDATQRRGFLKGVVGANQTFQTSPKNSFKIFSDFADNQKIAYFRKIEALIFGMGSQKITF